MYNSDFMFPNFDEILPEYDDHFDLIQFKAKIDELEEEYRDKLVLNPVKYKRFMEIYALILKLCEMIEGAVTQVSAEPQIGNNSVSFRVPLLYLVDDSHKLFQAIVARADLIGIDPILIESDDEQDAGLEIDVCVQNVWQIPQGK